MKMNGVSSAGGKIGQDCIDPEEREVRLGSSLNDSRIGLAAGTEGSEEERAGNDGEKDGRGEHGVFPCRVGNKRDADLSK